MNTVLYSPFQKGIVSNLLSCDMMQFNLYLVNYETLSFLPSFFHFFNFHTGIGSWLLHTIKQCKYLTMTMKQEGTALQWHDLLLSLGAPTFPSNIRIRWARKSTVGQVISWREVLLQIAGNYVLTPFLRWDIDDINNFFSEIKT